MTSNSSSGTVRVNLTPSAGFCIKSSTLKTAVCKVAGQSNAPQPASKLDGGPATLAGTLTVPKGIKIFINFTWDANVPPPPEGSEEVIQRAMRGEEEIDETNEEAWFVPVIVSELRNDVDKTGKPTVVFDCVYNASLKSRCLRDHAFREFLVELGLQRIEAQHSVSLSRKLGAPNIPSKGKLQPRSALIPLALYPAAHPLHASSSKDKKVLIEEIEPSAAAGGQKTAKEAVAPKGVLKTPKQVPQPTTAPHDSSRSITLADLGKKTMPKFEWTEDKDTNRILVTVHVPKLTYEHIQLATLDVEARRIVLEVPPLYSLDLDVSLPDAQIASIYGGSTSDEAASILNSALTLKRQRDFDVDGATAEWRVADGVVVISS